MSPAPPVLPKIHFLFSTFSFIRFIYNCYSSPLYLIRYTPPLHRDERTYFKGPVVTICTARINIQQFYVLPTQCVYVFCVDLRTNSDYFPIQH